MRILRPLTVIAAAALVISGTAVAVGAAGETDTVQLCRTTKKFGSVPAGTVTWPTDAICPAGTERFDVAAPSAATALGERLTEAETEITALKEADEAHEKVLQNVLGVLRAAHPASLELGLAFTGQNTASPQVQGSGLKPGQAVTYQDPGGSRNIGTVREDGQFFWTSGVPVGCDHFPASVSTLSALGEPVEDTIEFPCP